MIILLIAYIAFIIGCFLLLNNEIGNVNTKRLSVGTILTNVGMITIGIWNTWASIFVGISIALSFIIAIVMIIELLIIKSMEN